MLFVHPLIDPVIVSFGFLQIRWYSIAYVLGFVFGIYLIKKINNKFSSPLKNKVIDDFFVWSVLGVIIGGRIGYVFLYQLNNTLNDPLSIFLLWKGGMSFHGGLLGIIFSMLIFCKYKKINFLQLSDLVSTVAPLGIFFGRIANFINVELYGRITEFPIAMIYPTIDNFSRHPSQIYEALLEGLALLIILFLISNKSFRNDRFGLCTSIFLILYGVFRFFLEFLREPDLHLGLYYNFFTIGQLLSLPMIMLGFIIYYKTKNA